MPSEHKDRPTQRFNPLRSLSVHRETFHSRRLEGFTSYEERHLSRSSTFSYAAVSESHQSTSSSVPVPKDAPQCLLSQVLGNNRAGSRSYPSPLGGKPLCKETRTSWAATTSSQVTRAVPQPSRLAPGRPTPTPQSSKARVSPLMHVPRAYSAETPAQPFTAACLTSPFPPGTLPRASPGQAAPRVQPSQLDQLAGASQPAYTLASLTTDEERTAQRSALSIFSAAWEMVKANQQAARKVAIAKDDYLHAQAQQIRFEKVQQLLVAEQEERAKQVAVVMRVLQVCHPTSKLHARAESWLKSTMFSSHPSDDFVRLLRRIESSVGPVSYPEKELNTAGGTASPRAGPSAQTPTFQPPGIPPIELLSEEMVTLAREASFLFQ